MKKQYKSVLSVIVGWLFIPWLAHAEISVVTSIRPLALIAEELLAPIEDTSVTVIVPKNASPHGFSLKPSHLKLLLTSPVVLWLGPSFEPYLEKALKKRGLQSQGGVIAAEFVAGITLLPSRDIDDHSVAESHVETPEHGEGHHHDAHSHDDSPYDPHLWWSAENAAMLAKALTEALVQAHPAQRQALESSLVRFTQRLAELSRTYVFDRPASTASFVVYHDSLVYLEKELGRFSERRIALSSEMKPTIKDLLAIKVLMNRDKVHCIVLEPSASRKFLEKINPDARIREVMIDPLGWDADSYSMMWNKAAAQLTECSLP